MKRISKDLYKIDNVFPELICKKILKLFEKEKKWKFISQAREKHYRHVFSPQKNLDKKLFPSKKEIYFAKFYRSDNLKKNLFLNSEIKKYVFPYLEKIKIKYSNYEIRCHKFKKGNFLRLHYDHYAGTYAITINLNKEWKWDWGGLLCVLNNKKKNEINCLCPEWNSMNILYSLGKNKNSAHFVSSIEEYAISPRYSITIFLEK